MAESEEARGKVKKRVPFLMRFQHVEGILLTSTILYLGYYHLRPLVSPPETDDFGRKLQYVMFCSIVPFVVFLYSIGAVIAKRSKTNVVNPLEGRENLLQLEHSFAQNTLEQLTVFLVSTVVLATYLEGEELKLVPLNALVFTVGRIFFRVGYGVHPKYRGVGVWCSFSAQSIVLALCIYMLYTRGILFGLEEKVLPTAATESVPREEL